MTADTNTAINAKVHKKKKRKISKHVLQAQDDKLKQKQEPPEEDADGVTVVPPPPQLTPATKQKTSAAAAKKVVSSSKKNAKIKDPAEAASYLSQWKRHNDGDESVWKFNKNTQSWLIRHMYEADKLSKTTFATLLGYLRGLKGGDAKTRILQEATRRAVRYKEYEKAQDEQGEDSEDNDNNENTKTKEIDTADTAANPALTEEEEEDARWNKLDDHDKRKEYKRARKILDVIKEV
jgi:hypothetical protein